MATYKACTVAAGAKVMLHISSAVQVVCLNVGCYFFLPSVPIAKQLLLVVEQFLVGFG